MTVATRADQNRHKVLFHFIAAESVDLKTYKAASLETEGFIHLCTHTQLGAVRQRHFPDQRLVVLSLDARRLSDVRFEDTYGHGVFPHLYGALPVGAILSVTSVGIDDVITEVVPKSQPEVEPDRDSKNDR